MPATIASNVDLPAPLRPSNASDLPEGRVRLRLSMTTLRFPFIQKPLVTFSKRIMRPAYFRSRTA